MKGKRSNTVSYKAESLGRTIQIASDGDFDNYASSDKSKTIELKEINLKGTNGKKLRRIGTDSKREKLIALQ
jgi:hypothetical protein